MEELFTNIILLVFALGGVKVLLFYLLGKARQQMAATVRDNKSGKVVSLSPSVSDHYKYIYSQEEIYGSLYSQVKSKFKDAMKAGVLTSEQVWFIEKYLRNTLNDHKKVYKNNCHCIYTLLASPELDNENYRYISNVLDDFILR